MIHPMLYYIGHWKEQRWFSCGLSSQKANGSKSPNGKNTWNECRSLIRGMLKEGFLC